MMTRRPRNYSTGLMGVFPLMTNQRATNQTRKPILELDESTREAAEYLRESGGPAADLADVLIQLDNS